MINENEQTPKGDQDPKEAPQVKPPYKKIPKYINPDIPVRMSEYLEDLRKLQQKPQDSAGKPPPEPKG